MEHLYVPFVQIKYILGTGAIPFYECVTFFLIVYPKTDGVPLTQREIYRPFSPLWQAFRRPYC